MSTKPATARIDGILAREANVAVVFRRGPSKWTELLLWNLNTDEITPGQWIKGRVYTRRCDLSPDGRLLVGSYTNYSQTHRVNSAAPGVDHLLTTGWTAISRPPYFTGLATWLTGGSWNGGGLWRSAHRLDLNPSPDHWEFVEGRTPPLELGNLSLGRSEDEPIFTLRLEAFGWQRKQELTWRIANPDWEEHRRRLLESPAPQFDGSPDAIARMMEWVSLSQKSMPIYATDQPGEWMKTFRGGTLVRTAVIEADRWEARDGAGRMVLEFRRDPWTPQWLEVDQRGRIIYGDGGCLWAWADFPSGEPAMIADLNDHTFRPIAPPAWALEW